MRVLAKVFIHGVLFGLVSCVGARAAAITPVAAASASDDSAKPSFKSDREFVLAVFRNDKAAVARLLDDDFTWTDTQGRMFTKAQTLENLPALALGDENQVSEQEQVNRQIAIHRATRGSVYVLRVWVKRARGWRALIYHEVNQRKALPVAEPETQVCENPCKTVPFTPKDADERAVIEAYQAVERAVTAHDSATWGAVIADDFFAVTSESDHPLDKKTRMAGLDLQKQGGIAPFPLVSARMFKFSNTMIMTSLQQPAEGNAMRVTRVWNLQRGKWLEALSYQTRIQ